MPMEIVTDAWSATECNLTQQEIEQFVDEVTNYMEFFEPIFRRSTQLEWSKVYMLGLLRDTSRKNIVQMVIGIEPIFEEAKSEVGFDHNEMRGWLGWYYPNSNL
jgi:SRSO17 transposase